MMINVTVVATMARLQTPDTIGHAVTGIGIGAILLSLREFVTPEFLIQKKTIDQEDLRTSFTALLAVTILIGFGLAIMAPYLAAFYASPELPFFLLLIMLSALVDTFAQPFIAMLRREMQFGTLANLRTVSLLVSAVIILLNCLKV